MLCRKMFSIGMHGQRVWPGSARIYSGSLGTYSTPSDSWLINEFRSELYIVCFLTQKLTNFPIYRQTSNLELRL